jgi:hypothetical protein
MSVKALPHYTVSATALADWIESHPERWWAVVGEDYLMGSLCFPCPGEELAPVIRKIGKNLLVFDKNRNDAAQGQLIQAEKLDDQVDIIGRRPRKVLLLSWVDSDEDWLLEDDEPMVA